jgi:hypothetical protein
VYRGACRFGFDDKRRATSGKGDGGGWNVASPFNRFTFDQLPAGTWTVRA